MTDATTFDGFILLVTTFFLTKTCDYQTERSCMKNSDQLHIHCVFQFKMSYQCYHCHTVKAEDQKNLNSPLHIHQLSHRGHTAFQPAINFLRSLLFLGCAGGDFVHVLVAILSTSKVELISTVSSYVTSGRLYTVPSSGSITD